MDSMTLVTAFFPIGRDGWKKFGRSADRYFDYFTFWAGMENDLVVYTTPDAVQRVKDIRESFGRTNTTVIAIDDLPSVEPEVYGTLVRTMSNETFRAYHENPKCPESWNPDYNYLMAMKFWCLKDAVERGLTRENLAWIDFGYNHGGDYYTESSELRFDWKYDPEGKITLFKLKDNGDRPIYELIRSMDTIIEGCLFIVPSALCATLWELFKGNTFALAKAGLADDDQSVLYMCALERPELFRMVPSGWFQDIEICTGRHFTTREQKATSPFKMKVKRFWKATVWSLRTIRYRL